MVNCGGLVMACWGNSVRGMVLGAEVVGRLRGVLGRLANLLRDERGINKGGGSGWCWSLDSTCGLRPRERI